MPTKQASVKSPTKQQAKSSITQELTLHVQEIKNQLLKCAERGTPVLLYGKDDTTDGRKNLIYEIHKRALQTDAPIYTEDPKVPPVPQEAFRSLIKKCTEQTYIDCGYMDGAEIKEAVENVYCDPSRLTPTRISYPFADSPEVPRVNKDYIRRLFFLDNVSCNSQDEQYFKSAGKILKEECEKWIVVYAYNLESLHPYFRDQFEPISLEPEKQTAPQDMPKEQVSTFPIPSGTQKHEGERKDINEVYYDDKQGILFVNNLNVQLTAAVEKPFFEYFWDKSGNITVDDVIEYMTTFDEFSNVSWNRGYFDKTLSHINSKGKSLGIEKLIRNVERGEYSISVKIKKKPFKR